MPTLNYTTTIAVAKTAAEIQTMLGEHGADAIMIRYANRQPVAVSFSLTGPGGDRAFTLPVDVAAMHKALDRQHRAGKVARRYATTEHERVAWRVVKDWLAAQLALVAAQMASLEQVMLPYLHVDGDTTLYQAYLEQGRRALPAATD
jgi:hypothetical protein